MPKFIDLTGQVFDRLIALSHFHKNGQIFWHCRCSCGIFKAVAARSLHAGTTRSCGCLKREMEHTRFFKHGHNTRAGGTTREYRAWRAMLDRCSGGLRCYDGRGIKVCKRWHIFENFLKDMGPAPSPQHSPDRMNNDGNYTPSNVRWATRKQQMNNFSRNRILSLRGESKTLTQWCEILGLKYGTVFSRLKKGWSEEAALTIPIEHGQKIKVGPGLLKFKGESKTVRSWCQDFGIKPPTLTYRLRLGWSVEKALTTKVSLSLSERYGRL